MNTDLNFSIERYSPTSDDLRRAEGQLEYELERVESISVKEIQTVISGMKKDGRLFRFAQKVMFINRCLAEIEKFDSIAKNRRAS